MWVARQAAKRVERGQTVPQADDSDGDSVSSILSWVDEDETEVSQTCTEDDLLTSEQDDDTNSQREKITPMCVDLALTGTSVRQPHKHRENTDYAHKKKYKRKRHLPAVTINAVRNTGNPNHPNASVSLYDETMGVSVLLRAHLSVETTTRPSTP